MTLTPVSEESSVTDVLNKVTTGQADAGVVYVTDANGAGDKVTEVPFPESADAVNTYPIAVLKESTTPRSRRSSSNSSPGRRSEELPKAGFAKP